MYRISTLLILGFMAVFFAACNQPPAKPAVAEEPSAPPPVKTEAEASLERYEKVKLTTDLSVLTANQKAMLPLLFKAARIMNDLFWQQSYGDRNLLMGDSSLSAAEQELLLINYGPWDRLGNNEPFLIDAGPKPKGANLYPNDMTRQEFEIAPIEDKKSQYTLLRWDQNNNLISIPYSAAYQPELEEAAGYLREAAVLAEDPGLKKYLGLRAEALLNDDFTASDIAWLDMKTNVLDVIIGPIETYEDQMFGYKAAYEAYILVKDMAWSERLSQYLQYLPELQKSLPVDDKYKREKPGMDSELNAYDVIFYAGDCNAGSKTIAINLPNNEVLQREKGTRRLQLKNTMRAKFDQILVPISEVLIAEDQRKHITFEAFFGNTMFHEVAHGLGIKETITGKGTVRDALKEQASALEEGKADVLGIYMITKLYEMDVIQEGDLKDNYVTFMASIFRSVRFGASSAHGRANMLRFNFFKKEQAFTKDHATGEYRVDFDKMRSAIAKLSALILKYQGDGDYEGVVQLMDEKGTMGLPLQADLSRLLELGIPIDLIFDQGEETLGLEVAEEVVQGEE